MNKWSKGQRHLLIGPLLVEKFDREVAGLVDGQEDVHEQLEARTILHAKRRVVQIDDHIRPVQCRILKISSLKVIINKRKKKDVDIVPSHLLEFKCLVLKIVMTQLETNFAQIK